MTVQSIIPIIGMKIEKSNSSVTTSEYELLLPHIDPNFNNGRRYIAINCFPPFFNTETDRNIIRTYIQKRFSDDVELIFDNSHEGNVISCLSGIYELLEEIKVDHARCHFISGAIQAPEIHRKFCLDNSIMTPINVITLSPWELHIHKTMQNLEEPIYTKSNKEKLFLCFNRILRNHRVSLLGLLYDKGLVEKAYYSFFHQLSYDTHDVMHYVSATPLSNDIISIIKRNIYLNLKKFPLLLNNESGDNTNYILNTDDELYNNSYFSLVTETFFFKRDYRIWDENAVFFSEKTFKPIACKHPFILVSRPASLRYLKTLGYKTFHPYINEEYDLIENDQERLIAIVEEVIRLSNNTTKQWIEWMNNIEEIVEYNYNVIKNKTNVSAYVKDSKKI